MPLTCAMGLGLRKFAESNIAIIATLMQSRTATVLQRMVPPWVRQNPQHFHAATAALTPCMNLMCASTVTKEKKMKLFHVNAASSEKNQSLSSVMSVKQILTMLLRIQVGTLILNPVTQI